MSLHHTTRANNKKSRRTVSALLVIFTVGEKKPQTILKRPCTQRDLWKTTPSVAQGCSSPLPPAVTCFLCPFWFSMCSPVPTYPLLLGEFREGTVSVGMWVFSVCDCILASPFQYLYQDYSQSSLIWILSFLCGNSRTGEAVRGSGFPSHCLNFCPVQLWEREASPWSSFDFNILSGYGVTHYLWIYGFQFSFLYLQSLVHVDVTCVKNWNSGCALKIKPSFLTIAALIKMKINTQAKNVTQDFALFKGILLFFFKWGFNRIIYVCFIILKLAYHWNLKTPFHSCI